MKNINEIMDEMSELRNKAQSVARESDAMWDKVKSRGVEIATDILDYWLANGGLDRKYFKSPYYCHNWETMDLPASRCYSEFVRIDKFLFHSGLGIHFCGRTFSLGDGLKVNCAVDDRPNQVIRISQLHPDNLITREEFEKGKAEYEKRFNEYVDKLVDNGRDTSNVVVGFSSGTEVKCAYHSVRDLPCD